jgi:hypothetical protein
VSRFHNRRNFTEIRASTVGDTLTTFSDKEAAMAEIDVGTSGVIR